ncbi:hypothetical protein [Chryseobacterium takakiae]|jgi:hypothetical protein|uniref:Uncharacterized protein n=1 Tax=Chryseobacterium takakiae TaxID=1302685 RepID=A0A1M4UHC7_9FLAO|nr:hypothetical protein [Chryseobacterium takakiae]SHE55960.1 hypothetical protein SAMN05444408_102101 [Chryseobacterium takakiae]
MENVFFIKELFDDLSSYDILTLENLFNTIKDERCTTVNLNRFTFEKKGGDILISDDVSYDDIGVFNMNIDEFLKLLSSIMRKE